MALRVLLADESLNVKKNMQLCLQDYGVEIKSLLSGEDVSTATKTFKPDIIFLDILLSKINGYDACSQLKNHPDFRHIPIILMWSSFMEIDENKFKLARAEGRLEKPFDKLSLRKIIQHFVPKTKTQGLSEFLTLPELRPFVESNAGDENSLQEHGKTLTHFNPRGLLGDLRLDDEPDEFQQVSAPFQSTTPEISPLTTQNEEPEEWMPQPLHSASASMPAAPPSGFSAKNSPLVEENYEVEIANIQLPENISPPPPPTPELDAHSPLGRARMKAMPPPPHPNVPTPPISHKKNTATATQNISWDHPRLQEMIRAELRPIVEELLLKSLPEIAERVIREEIQKLMTDSD